jgi:hypothetical protein
MGPQSRRERWGVTYLCQGKPRRSEHRTRQSCFAGERVPVSSPGAVNGIEQHLILAAAPSGAGRRRRGGSSDQVLACWGRGFGGCISGSQTPRASRGMFSTILLQQRRGSNTKLRKRATTSGKDTCQIESREGEGTFLTSTMVAWAPGSSTPLPCKRGRKQWLPPPPLLAPADLHEETASGKNNKLA